MRQSEQKKQAPETAADQTNFTKFQKNGGWHLNSSGRFLAFALALGWRQARHRDPHDRVLRTHSLDSTRIALKTPVIADLQMQGSIACRRLACLDALSAAVAKRFIDCVFVIVVIGILFIDFAYDSSFKRILRACFPCRKAFFIRLACDIESKQGTAGSIHTL